MNQKQLRQLASIIVVVALVVVGCLQNQKKGGGGTVGGGGGNCRDEFPAGQPQPVSAGSVLLCRNEYINVYDPQRKVPLVVGEHLTRQELRGDVPRTDDFQPDPELRSGQRAELNDYRASGYDRGHMAPAADFVAGQTQMQQSFYLSNMVPQNGELNRGLWAGLEGATRACAKRLGELYVLTGPIFEGRAHVIGKDQVAVPSSLYKIVVSGGAARAFLVPNRAVPKTSRFTRYETSVDEVQRATGLTFFPAGGVHTQQAGTFCQDAYGS